MGCDENFPPAALHSERLGRRGSVFVRQAKTNRVVFFRQALGESRSRHRDGKRDAVLTGAIPSSPYDVG